MWHSFASLKFPVPILENSASLCIGVQTVTLLKKLTVFFFRYRKAIFPQHFSSPLLWNYSSPTEA